MARGGGSSRGKDGLRHEMSCWVAAVRTHYMVVLIFTIIVYFPRLCLSFFVFFVAQFLRLIARLLGVVTNRPITNRRILVVTDYMPPQTHGIAIRCHAYVKELRAQGHEVIVFATAYEASKETSFDHPNIPSVVNPFNLGNRIGYNPGVKLAWFLGAYTWDVVHVVFPSLLGVFVLPLCAWRRIPVYCSHHVEMDMFAHKHVAFPAIARFGLFMYDLIGKWPAVIWGTMNAAPTLCFARDHLGRSLDETLRRVPSGTHDIFTVVPGSAGEREEVRRTRFGVEDGAARVILMVQRLSSEKGTERIFPALAGGEVDEHSVLVVAGDGPSKNFLKSEARRRGIRAVFLGNVPHQELPALYRAADCFVTMSLSETFGLTCLEAQMCGCPAVMPFCKVFDEIWSERVPKAWRYNISSTSELAAAIKAAQTSGRQFLKEHPVQMTWKDAAKELLTHYEECIARNQKHRDALREIVILLDHCLRMLVFSILAAWVLSYYYRGLQFFGAALASGPSSRGG
eukprot:TRINITY_DN2838_c0_g6_i1.p2 TRINITY_DN2838_c0_g6~~TRINITY_DN2838_c0_g6_i1.p2  ORF type:complete len:541 (-),score=73.00 TRINITY_DN2838_c0_g6_i1:83-1618(-)